MIYCVEGTPGVGKSLYFVSKLIPEYLKIEAYDGSYMPVHIWTNIEGLKPSILLALSGLPESIAMFIHNIGECVDDYGNRDVDKRYLEWFYYDPQTIEWVQDTDPKTRQVYWHPNFDTAKYLPINSLIILDELQNIFGSRDFDKPFTKAALPYITRHRHYGHNIFWASQNHEQVDVAFRRNTEQVWHLEGLDNFALFGGASMFKIQKYEGKFAGYQVGVPPYAVQKVTKDKRYFNAYKSHVSGDVREKKHTSNMFLNSKPFMIMVIIFFLCVGYIIFSGNPLKKINAFKTNESTAIQSLARPPSTTGLAPTEGARAQVGGVPANLNQPEKKESEKVCITNEFTHNGINYVVVNGRQQPKEKGVEYEFCN